MIPVALQLSTLVADDCKPPLLEEIRYYLQQTDLNVKQICDRLGFSNTSFFGKYVKDHFGMPPIQFRNAFTRMASFSKKTS